jgi:2-methylfumaryl-CoA hydratase
MTEIVVGGPWFEDFVPGQIFDAPSVTLNSAHAVLHQAVVGDRLRLPLDERLAQAVTGNSRPLAHPALVANLAIGQSTPASFRVKANLFYRGLVLRQPVFIGDTLSTSTKVVALRQNAAKAGRAATGLVVLEITTLNQDGETVLKFWRCPMISCRDPEANTGLADSLDAIPSEIPQSEIDAAVPRGWSLEEFRRRIAGAHFSDLAVGANYVVEARDSVSSAPELARMTLNMAMTHFDAAQSTYKLRLIFGGQAIALALALAVRALPNMVTVLAWRGCDHLAPVFEGDMLGATLAIEALRPLPGGGGLVDLRAIVRSERSADAQRLGQPKEADVLDWRFVALMA